MSSAIVAAVTAGLVTGSINHNDLMVQQIDSQVRVAIEQVHDFNSIKESIMADWQNLVETGALIVTGTDKDVRPRFVALQGIVEQALSCELGKSIKSLTGVIHTPMPATPLCTKGAVSADLVDPTVEQDPLRSATVKARTTIIRDYLYKGGDLYVAYPKDGMGKRTAAQQEIYVSELENYPAHLFDHPMDCDSIADDLVGAFYLFKNQDNKLFVFAIKMSQANNIEESANFGLWFGEYNNESPAKERIEAVLKAFPLFVPELN